MPGLHKPDPLGAGSHHQRGVQHSPGDVVSKQLPARLRPAAVRTLGPLQGDRLLRPLEVWGVSDVSI
eukprot:7637462-Alexandrium_andersonii.AAC.1